MSRLPITGKTCCSSVAMHCLLCFSVWVGLVSRCRSRATVSNSACLARTAAATARSASSRSVRRTSALRLSGGSSLHPEELGLFARVLQGDASAILPVSAESRSAFLAPDKEAKDPDLGSWVDSEGEPLPIGERVRQWLARGRSAPAPSCVAYLKLRQATRLSCHRSPLGTQCTVRCTVGKPALLESDGTASSRCHQRISRFIL